MSERPIVLGVDCGLAKLGYAFVQLGDKWNVRALGCITTAPATAKAGITASADLARRARNIHVALCNLCVENGMPLVICAEAFSYPRVPGKVRGTCPRCKRSGSSIMPKPVAQLGYGWGVLCSLANEMREAPIAQVSPQDIKKALCGRGNATKADVQEQLKIHFRQMALFEKLNKGHVEHAADALGAIVACRDTEIMRMARRQAAEDRND